MIRRQRNAAATTDRLLACARRRFLQESYENVGLRDIAGDAGVDVALIGRYFGSKAELFKEVLRGGGAEWLKDLDGADDLAAYLARLAAERERSDDCDRLERLLIILRSVSSPQAAPLVRASFRHDVLEPIAKALNGPHSEMRAGLALSVLMGTTIVRTIMNVEALHECDRKVFETKLTQLLRSAIVEATNE